jgi:glucose/arabinose dehydrogenase
MRITIVPILAILGFLLLSCEDSNPLPEEESPSGTPVFKTETILTGYEIIWGMDFLPSGDLIFGEKRGRLYRRTGETVTELSGFPAVLGNGQGGLLDIRVHPDNKTNGWIYATYSASNPSGGGQLKLIRFKISGNQLTNIETIFTTNGQNTWYGHYGSRIVFDGKGFLYLSVGEGGSTSYGGPYTGNSNAQLLSSSWGKIHRIHDDGRIPSDNPVFQGMTGPTSVFSYGHRNPQGIALNPSTGEIWATEHGPKGGDEVNIIKKGANYGWPVYSLGTNYDGSVISQGHSASGITEPLYSWTPSVGTCGIAFITSTKFLSWKGSLAVCGLASQKLYRCTVENNSISAEEEILTGYGRVRNVIQGPDGYLYVSVEDPGRILRLKPE